MVYIRNESEPLTAAQVFPTLLLYDMMSALLYLVPLMIDTLLANKHSSSRLADLFAIKASYSRSDNQHTVSIFIYMIASLKELNMN